MNNHAHFLIYAEKSEYLGKYMQRLNTAYSRFYNKINNRVGYVFRNRYNSQEILNEEQLYNCIRYIHNNPVEAGISKTMKEYKYSSYNEFYGKKEIINEEGVKLVFGTARDFKEQFENIHLTRDITETFLEAKEVKIEDFIREIEYRYNKNINTIKDDKILLEQVIKEARKKIDITITELSKILDISKSTIANYAKK